MSLADIWFGLFILIVAGYLILDGFDLGVGILHLPVARTDLERRTFLASIGPVWDGNAVWLVLTGGVLFACFPLAYASLFSGFYLAFMLVLVCLILRAVAIEFRSKEPSSRWRSGWDLVFAARVAGPRAAAGHRLRQHRPGRAHRQRRQHGRDASSTCSTRSRCCSASRPWSCSRLHGSLYLLLKTSGALHDRVRALVPRLIVAVRGAASCWSAVALFVDDRQIVQKFTHDIWPLIFPLAAAGRPVRGSGGWSGTGATARRSRARRR